MFFKLKINWLSRKVQTNSFKDYQTEGVVSFIWCVVGYLSILRAVDLLLIAN